MCSPGDVDNFISKDVQMLQCHLINLGYSDLDNVGHFGRKTEKAVKYFQEKHDLEVDGIVTRNVWCVIIGLPGCENEN